MVIIGLGFLIGLILGSLVDCLALRSLTKESFWGRSYCDKCKKTLAWYDLIPVISFIFNKCKCRLCGRRLSFEYPLVEITTGILIALLFYQVIPSNVINLSLISWTLIGGEVILKIITIIVLSAVFITDIKTGLIPDRITYPAIFLYLISLCIFTLTKIVIIYISLSNTSLGKYLLPPYSDYFYRHALIAAMPLGYGVLAAFILGLFFFSLIVLTKGKGMGGGDFKLSIFIGLVLGIPNAFVGLMLAFLSGSIVGVLLILIGKKQLGQTIPFGPFLSLGALLALFWGDQILDWYLKVKL